MGNYTSEHTGAEHDAYCTKAQLINLIYPVGAIYMSVNSTSPATLFGGTWQAIEGKFLVGADSTFTAGDSGGNDTHTHTYSHTHTTPATTTGGHTLTEAEIPSHTHQLGYRTNTNITTGSSGQWTVDPGTVTAWAPAGSAISSTGGGGPILIHKSQQSPIHKVQPSHQKFPISRHILPFTFGSALRKYKMGGVVNG